MEQLQNNASGGRAAEIKILSSMVIFGTIGIFVRYIPLPSAVIALARGTIGTLFLLLVSRIKKQRLSFAAIRCNLLPLCIAGLFLGANWILLFEAYRYTTIAVATLCYYLAPIFIMLAAPFVLKEKLTAARVCCICAALIGMVLVSGVAENGRLGPDASLGILFGIGAALLYAAIVLLNKRLKAISAFDTTVVQLAISALTLLPYVLFTGGTSLSPLSLPSLFVLLLVGIVHTGVAYALYFGSISGLKAHQAALFSYIDPVVAILLSSLVLKERMRPAGVLGAVLVLGATLACELWENRTKRSE